MLGGYGYAANAFLFSIRAGLFASLSDDWLDRNNRRLKIGLIFWVAGACVIGALGLYLSLWHLLPGLAMTCGVAATAMSSRSDHNANDKSHYARLLYLVANSFNAIYSAFYSHSAAGFIADSLNIRGLATGICEFDMPSYDENGKTMTGQDKLRRYAKKLCPALRR